MAISENIQKTDDTPSKCANPACSCNVSPDQKYCSEHCASMATMDSCDCGHLECEAYTEQER
ncbi:hypothetical protein [Candidatus Methylomicrobium oryzae]|uniref:hypothetical protein n=1 Tax=Candidatus Methylomicrobium oryzae TaxID=2802053 RepID=UPI0019235091|nr:hypothetical protein [Methylomicrobium sp. RS1]MBL1263054.1 hypothetical protein [Methylomicrobium sp. RS1]